MSNINEKKGLEEFLLEQDQKSTSILGTLKQSDLDKDKVIFTPYFEGTGNCSNSITISKELIDSVLPTDKKVLCCGKSLTLVEVFFKDGASLSLKEVLGSMMKMQIISSKSQPQKNNFHNFNAPHGLKPSIENFRMSPTTNALGTCVCGFNSWTTCRDNGDGTSTLWYESDCFDTETHLHCGHDGPRIIGSC